MKKSRVIILLVVSAVVLVGIVFGAKKADYQSKLISAFEAQEEVAVEHIFHFEFERAYILNDCYISGEGFAKRYDLDISISQVKSGASENIQRIVFVDAQGHFVYEFKCDSSKILIAETGTVIYPQTIIEKQFSESQKPLKLYFNSSEHYDS